MTSEAFQIADAPSSRLIVSTHNFYAGLTDAVRRDPPCAISRLFVRLLRRLPAPSLSRFLTVVAWLSSLGALVALPFTRICYLANGEPLSSVFILTLPRYRRLAACGVAAVVLMYWCLVVGLVYRVSAALAVTLWSAWVSLPITVLISVVVILPSMSQISIVANLFYASTFGSQIGYYAGNLVQHEGVGGAPGFRLVVKVRQCMEFDRSFGGLCKRGDEDVLRQPAPAWQGFVPKREQDSVV